MSDITACLVTRGDQPDKLAEILASLIFDRVVVWDNSVEDDWKCAGRYMATLRAGEYVYFQDDDVVVPRKTQETLMEAFYSSDAPIVANWGHGENPAGYDDLPLVCGGAIAEKGAVWRSITRYAEHHPLDESFKYEADFIVGVLYPSFEHVHLPFEIDYEIAQAPERLVNQPWQKELKLKMTERARLVRDTGLVPA